MSYMRSRDYYIKSDGENEDLHIWVKDGYDAWDNSMWACKRPEHPELVDFDDESTMVCEREEGYENASGVKIPMDVMDEYVVMRILELIIQGKVCATVDRAITRWERPNLIACADQLKHAIGNIHID